MSFRKEVWKFFKSHCRKCGEELQKAQGWDGKYKCSNDHSPEHYNRGIGR